MKQRDVFGRTRFERFVYDWSGFIGCAIFIVGLIVLLCAILSVTVGSGNSYCPHGHLVMIPAGKGILIPVCQSN